MLRLLRPAAALALAALLICPLPVRGARPLLDLHKWDSYFALYARDSDVPWTTTTVRLDTYSSAHVDFAVYAMDAGDVIVAGANSRPRTISTVRLRPIAKWSFTPPGGYQYESNEIAIPLGSREGFFVVEARRGNVAEQVWINRTRVGLLTKENAGGVLLYGADLGTGSALAGMRVTFLVHGRFEQRTTDAHGIVRWTGPHPIFALARWGASTSFVTLLPQVPVQSSVAGVMVDSAVVHAGDDVHVVGFVRTRSSGIFKPAQGDVTIALRNRGALVVERRARLDAAGVVSLSLGVPAESGAGDYAVILSGSGASAGTTLRVDANAGGVALRIAADCRGACSANDDVPIEVRATRGAEAVADHQIHVNVVRSPHAYADGSANANDWGTTTVFDRAVTTDASGVARFTIARPTDGLSSTYGIIADSGGATAATRLVVATAPLALHLRLDRTQLSFGNPIRLEVEARDLSDGKPAARLAVTLQLQHGTSIQQQTVSLDGDGRARASFTAPELGSNLVLAGATIDGRQAMDAQAVSVVPQADAAPSETRSSDVGITLDRERYRVGDRIAVSAFAAGATGDALLTYESVQRTETVVVPVRDGRASAAFAARNVGGEVAVGAAFVHDGKLLWSSLPVPIDGAGRPEQLAAPFEQTQFAPGATAQANLGKTDAVQTVVVRVTDGVPSGSAAFDGAPELLTAGTTSSQDSAPSDPDWHAGVNASGTAPASMAFETRAPETPQNDALADAQTRDVSWQMTRSDSGEVTVPMPAAPGRYTISILTFSDDGRIGASSVSVVVQ